jgi:hypothetical protein
VSASLAYLGLNAAASAYRFIQPCLPTKALQLPTGEERKGRFDLRDEREMAFNGESILRSHMSLLMKKAKTGMSRGP